MICAKLAAGTAIALTCAVAFAAPASAHGGEADTASNYRTRIIAITPDPSGLSMKVIESGTRMSLTNDTDADVIVLGYQDEPYLRITNDGVFENTNSPATYLNSTLDGRAPIPPEADPKASPIWRRVSDGRTASWHDHRAHWMSPLPPPAVQANPNVMHVIYDEWVIDLVVNGEPVVITGDLAWIPPPSRIPALLIALAAFVGLAMVLQTRSWKPVAVAVAIIGFVLDGFATFGYYLESVDTQTNRLWLFVFTVLMATAAARLVAQIRRGINHPPVSMMAAGLLLLLMGGLDHIAVLSNSQIAFGFSASIARLAVIVELALGAALFTTFVVSLLSSDAHRGSPDSESGAATT